MDAGRRLLGHALDLAGDARPLLRVGGERRLEQLEDDLELVRVGACGIGHGARALELGALVDEHRRVAAVVEQHVRRAAVRPRQRLLRAPPVGLERLALPGEDRHAARRLRRPLGADRDRGRRVVLRREDVARRPAHLGTERDERLDQDGRLDRHVQRAGDPRAAQRLRAAYSRAHGHQAGHLVLGEADLLASPLGQAEVGDLEVDVASLLGTDLRHAWAPRGWVVALRRGPRHLEQVGDHHVLVGEAQVIRVGQLLDPLDLARVLQEQGPEREEAEVYDLRAQPTVGEQAGGLDLADDRQLHDVGRRAVGHQPRQEAR